MKVNVMRSTIQLLAGIALAAYTSNAQAPISIDLSYGRDGIAVENIPSHWLGMDILSWHAFEDASALVVRAGSVEDTVGYVARMNRTGNADLFYGRDGTVPIGAATSTMKMVSFIDNVVLLGGLRAGRFEMIGIDENGKIDNRLFWQDDEKTYPMISMGVQPNGTIVFWNKTSNWDETTIGLRYVAAAPYQERSVSRYEIDPRPMQFHNGSDWDPVGGRYVDAQGRLLMAAPYGGDRLVVMRVTADGELDEGFGNVVGMSMISIPDGATVSPYSIQIQQLPEGGYVVVSVANPDGTIDSRRMFVHKLRDNGSPQPGFGNDGCVVLNGNQMTNRGLTILPNGDFIVLSFGTYAYSHLYHLTRNGQIVPGEYGDFWMTSLMSPGIIVQDRWLYGLVGLQGASARLARFDLHRNVTSIHESPQLPIEMSVSGGTLKVSGVDGRATMMVYSIAGHQVLRDEFEGDASISLTEHVMPGPYAVVLAHSDGTLHRQLIFVQ